MKDILVVDGYNVIFGWPELQALSRDSLEQSRFALQEILHNYGHYKGYEIILVFDGKKTGEVGSEEYIDKKFLLVFTAKGETADSYIERTVFEKKDRFTNIFVVTSDGAEQHQILGSGGLRIPVRELRNEIKRAKNDEQEYYNGTVPNTISRNELAGLVDESVAKKLEALRRKR